RLSPDRARYARLSPGGRSVARPYLCRRRLSPMSRSLLALLLVAGLVPVAHAQPARDEAGIAAAFARIVALAHADNVAAALPLVVCPVAGEAGALVPVPCDPARLDHRARAEW